VGSPISLSTTRSWDSCVPPWPALSTWLMNRSLWGPVALTPGFTPFHQVVHVDLPRQTRVRSLEGERLANSLNKQLRAECRSCARLPSVTSFTRAFLPGGVSTATWSWRTTPRDLTPRIRGRGRSLVRSTWPR